MAFFSRQTQTKIGENPSKTPTAGLERGQDAQRLENFVGEKTQSDEMDRGAKTIRD